MRIQRPAEVEFLWPSDWRCNRHFQGRVVTVVQFEGSRFPGQFKPIVKLFGYGMQLNVTTEPE